MELNGNLPAFSELSSIGLSHGALARVENARGTRLRVENRLGMGHTRTLRR